MKAFAGILLCLGLAIPGGILGWQIGDRVGIAALPPNAWAGDGIGLMIDDVIGGGVGGLLGSGLGGLCLLVWHRINRKRRPQDVITDEQVWPPPPQMS